MISTIRYILYTICIFLSLIIITPICLIRPLSPKNNTVYFVVFRWLVEVIVGIKVHTTGQEIIKQTHPSVLIGNHQHNYDVATISQLFINHVIVLGKFELGLIPYFGQIYVLCGNTLIKRGNRKKAMQSMENLENKIMTKSLSILVFPEGHRNQSEELLPFKKGAFHTAIRTQSPLIPFSVSQFIRFQDLNKFKRIHIYVKIHPPIPTKGLTKKDIPELILKSRKAIKEGIKELNQNYSSK
ncbi:MAG: 1-acylglycerol-3-phosphate O-acyltransferase [Halobacteriovoraceae bacterium]|jgi:1-acyl-sn-glycerol-3-phosphate acyltransferase|nr:1-acylglycerol-3-phosphate O-acyltransferase [Halobacteriovoraceae bacterium]